MTVRVLNVVARLARGGAQTTILEIMRGVEKAGVGIETTLLVGGDQAEEGDLSSMAEQFGLKVIQKKWLKWKISPLGDVVAFFALRRLIRDGKFAIVHSHGSKAGVLGRLVVATLPNVRSLHSIHGWPFFPGQPVLKRAFYIGIEKFVFRFGAEHFVVSEADAKKAQGVGIAKASDFRLIRAGIDFSRFEDRWDRRKNVRKMWGVDDDDLVLGSVMRFAVEKDPMTFIEVTRRVLKKHPGIRAIVIGDGPLFRKTCVYASQFPELAHRLKMLGEVPDAGELIAGFDLFLMTSVTEGLPLTLLEALASHVPVVATDVGGISELISSDPPRNGVICGIGDIDSLTAAVDKLVMSATVRKNLLKDVENDLEDFSSDKMVARWTQVYRDTSA